MNEHSPTRDVASRAPVRLRRGAHHRMNSPANREIGEGGSLNRAGSGLVTKFGRRGPHLFEGYAVDPADLARRYVVQLIVDGVPVQVAVADQFDGALASQSLGDGCYGFSFAIASEILSSAAFVEARIANSGALVGAPVHLRGADGAARVSQDLRGVRWIGGLRFCGWIEGVGRDTPRVIAIIDGLPVTEACARTWHQVGGRGEEMKAVPAFDMHLPARFADGRVRSVRFVDEAGEDMPGSPLTFVAFEDGLERTLSELAQLDSERLRGEMYDRLIPASLPMSQYAAWLKRFSSSAPTIGMSDPLAVIFVGQGDGELSTDSLRDQTHPSWIAATLPATNEPVAFDPAQLDDFLANDGSDCDVVIFALCGLRLSSRAVEAFSAAFSESPGAKVIYADLSVSGSSGEAWPIFLPAFDYERMLEQGCGTYLFATRRQHLERGLAGCPRNLFHVFNELVGDSAAGRSEIVHLPGVLGLLPPLEHDTGLALAAATSEHLRRRGIEADVTLRTGSLFPAVRVQRRINRQSLSIIIPTRNHVGLLRRCLETIAPAATSAEIIVVDNDSSDPETLDFLAEIDGKSANVVRVPGVFNFSRLNNIAAAAAKSDLLCLLNNDIEALDDLWLDEMMGRLIEPDVGAVGATLLWPSGVVQHAGVVLGPNLGAAHAFTDRMQGDCGYADMLAVAHECSAVTAACLLTRKADYLAVGGMDEIYFPVNFNDVDYCLKLRALGRRIVVTPDARLLHLESASRGTDERPDRAGRLHRELRTLRAKWLETIVNDPYYSPLLSLDSIPFSALAWPPRANSSRFNPAPRATLVPPGM